MTETPFHDTLKALLAALGSNDRSQRQKARLKIRDTLAANRRSWNDLMANLHFRGMQSSKLKKLFAMLGDMEGFYRLAFFRVSTRMVQLAR